MVDAADKIVDTSGTSREMVRYGLKNVDSSRRGRENSSAQNIKDKSHLETTRFRRRENLTESKTVERKEASSKTVVESTSRPRRGGHVQSANLMKESTEEVQTSIQTSIPPRRLQKKTDAQPKDAQNVAKLMKPRGTLRKAATETSVNKVLPQERIGISKPRAACLSGSTMVDRTVPLRRMGQKAVANSTKKPVSRQDCVIKTDEPPLSKRGRLTKSTELKVEITSRAELEGDDEVPVETVVNDLVTCDGVKTYTILDAVEETRDDTLEMPLGDAHNEFVPPVETTVEAASRDKQVDTILQFADDGVEDSAVVHNVSKLVYEEDRCDIPQDNNENVVVTRRSRRRNVSDNEDSATNGRASRVTKRGPRRTRSAALKKTVQDCDESLESNLIVESENKVVDVPSIAPAELNDDSAKLPKKASAKRKPKKVAATSLDVSQCTEGDEKTPEETAPLPPLTRSRKKNKDVEQKEAVETDDIASENAGNSVITNTIEVNTSGKDVSDQPIVDAEKTISPQVQSTTDNTNGQENIETGEQTASKRKRKSLLENFIGLFTTQAASQDNNVTASGGNHRDSVASNSSSCSAAEEIIETSGLVEGQPFYSLNPAMLDDRNLWEDKNLRKLCKILHIPSDGDYSEVLERLNTWNRDVKAFKQFMSRKNKNNDLDDGVDVNTPSKRDRQYKAVCNFHCLSLGKQHLLPMYLRPLRRLSRKHRFKPILSSHMNSEKASHFTPRPIKKFKPKPSLVFSPYNQVINFQLMKEERQDKRRRIHEIAQSVDNMDNPMEELEGDERWMEARRNLFENCFRSRQYQEIDSFEDRFSPANAFDPLYLRATEDAVEENDNVLRWHQHCVEGDYKRDSLHNCDVWDEDVTRFADRLGTTGLGTPPRRRALDGQRAMFAPTPPRGVARPEVGSVLEGKDCSGDAYSGDCSGDLLSPESEAVVLA